MDGWTLPYKVSLRGKCDGAPREIDCSKLSLRQCPQAPRSRRDRTEIGPRSRRDRTEIGPRSDRDRTEMRFEPCGARAPRRNPRLIRRRISEHNSPQSEDLGDGYGSASLVLHDPANTSRAVGCYSPCAKLTYSQWGQVGIICIAYHAIFMQSPCCYICMHPTITHRTAGLRQHTRV